MGFEERNMDILQNIEFAIVSVYEERPTLLDYRVMSALDALIGIYRAESSGHTQKQISLEDEEMEILDRVKSVCEWRLGRTQKPEGLEVPPVQPTSLDDVLSCLRKIRKSVDRWNSRGGPQGYLRFVSEYVG
jgi:hypothetical protein